MAHFAFFITVLCGAGSKPALLDFKHRLCPNARHYCQRAHCGRVELRRRLHRIRTQRTPLLELPD
jgi:hypothetical protein